MKLLELHLDGYKRLMLNNIKQFRYTPTDVYQIILGTNGSGKSSVVFEASPLPANPADFVKGGRKYSKWLHNGRIYELSSSFVSGSARHSFLIDGEEELNRGGTITIQKELVESHFNYTPEIHELLVGVDKFTSMSFTKRRDWLTKLCDTDFSYALAMHKKLASAARDHQGAVKHVANRLTDETLKLKSLGVSEDDEDELKLLNEELNLLYMARDARPPSGSHQRLKQLEQEEEQLAQRVLALRQSDSVIKRFDSLESLGEAAETARYKVEALQLSINHTSNSLDDLLKLQYTVQQSGVSDVDAARQEIHQLQDRSLGLRQQIRQYQWDGQTDAFGTLQALDNAREEFMAIVQEIPDNVGMRFNRESVTQVREATRELRENIANLNNRISREEIKLEHLNGVCQQECPSCKHRWYPDNADDRKGMIEDFVAKARIKVTDFQKELEVNETYLTEAETFSGYLTRFKGLVNSYRSLKPLWDRMVEANAIHDNPKRWIRDYGLFAEDVKVWVELEDVDKRLQKLEMALKAMESATGFESLSTHILETEGKIETLTTELVEAKEHYQKLAKAMRDAQAITEAGERFKALHEQKLGAYEQLVVEYRNRGIDNVISSHQARLGTLKSKITEKHAVEGLINDLMLDHELTCKKWETYKMLAKILSPVDGLIAEQLIGFIKAFTDHMNTLIGNVWEYDLSIVPCGLESGELDYKFPIQVKSESNRVPDVAKGSTGQCEIIDFAFKLIVMLYLRLTDYPLYLDELGHSFDEQHRINVMNFVKDLVETKGFSQVFMISHYASSHGSFTNAEVLVMDAANITVPMRHNQHVTMA